ncbi:metallophosphoesterase [Adhaeribacter soli]|uniref:Metallophosphoesterase n=1 Tax=Adhaeribacter soli TaxID=2607655 RepID=A0A5N1J293_9BACT|nr:metallophosphoesterase [Adhaeribacter soli]KAA9340893.1 metallophosphoesterase [Adhaeribacter soli]
MSSKFFYLLVVSALLFLIDFYVFQAVRLACQNFSAGVQRGIFSFYWLLYVVTAITFILASLTRGTPPTPFKTYLASCLLIFFSFKLVVVVFLLLDDVSRLVRFIAAKITAEPAADSEGIKIPRSEFLSKLGLLAGAIPFTALIYGMVKGAFQYQVKKVVIKAPNLPAGFHGFKMVQISDLHTGSFRNDGPLRRAVSIINNLEADIVCFTGDLVNNVADEVQPYIPVLGQIRGKMGIFSVLGNHDYGDYVSWDTRTAKLENLERLKNSYARMGWRLLMNEHIPLERNGDQIALLGIENWGMRAGFPKYGKMYKAYPGSEKYPFKVLLSHDPSHWDGEVNLKYPDIDLMISGHTHGMQFGVNLPGFKWSPVQYVYKQWSGLYKKGSQHLYVNVGLGFLGYPGRVGFLPEITLFEFQRA